jgi:hypothetical protein
MSKNPDHVPQLTRIERQAIKRADAEKRQKQYEARSPQQQLDLLVERGHGHCGEAVALRAQIEGK